MKFTAIALAFVSTAYAFSPLQGQASKPSTKAPQSSVTPSDMDSSKPIFDPLGIYPKDAPERAAGLINPLESSNPKTDNTVTDPMNLYKDKSQVDQNVQMSASLPFLKRPELLDGSLPGDRGFDPLNFSQNESSLQWYRNAEIKHARIAMLAAAGWPLAELFDKKIAYALDLKPLLVFQDRVPSVLNGGLDRINPAYWVAVLGIASVVEALGLFKENEAQKAGIPYTPGDFGFDPLGLFGKTEQDKTFKLEAELFNGRLAMLAIFGFAIQEWWTQNSVINEFPIFFKPLNVAMEQLADAAGNM